MKLSQAQISEAKEFYRGRNGLLSYIINACGLDPLDMSEGNKELCTNVMYAFMKRYQESQGDLAKAPPRGKQGRIRSRAMSFLRADIGDGFERYKSEEGIKKEIDLEDYVGR